MDARLPKAEGLTGSLFAILTTLIAVAALARSFLPPDWIRAVRRFGNRVTRLMDPFCYFTFSEFTGQSPDQNYERIKLYLSGKGIASARRVLVSQPKNSAQPVFALADNEALTDTYMGIAMLWTHYVSQRTTTVIYTNSTTSENTHSFCLQVHSKHQHMVQQYLAHVRREADIIEKKGRELLVYNNTGGEAGFRRPGMRMWDSLPFKHPATFNTLALDTKLKQAVMQKLDSFSQDGEFYSQTGRAHKMGFFLFGPPGTGKTTFAAAVANHMQYSIYDLDLTGVNSNLDLRALLTQISDRSVVVIEDIDTVELPNRGSASTMQEAGGPPERFGRKGREEDSRSKLTLGGVLNFADGIRSSCGSEHIFIFTTNHPERLDPALIRPGRMDMHIELSYCTFEVLKSLCRTYLGVTDHPTLKDIQAVLAPSAKVAPADVTAILDANRLSPDRALQNMLEHLQQRVAQ